MAISDEQAKFIKEQIIKQIESNFPEDKREFAKKYILSLNGEQLEEFLIKNRLIKAPEQSENAGSAQQKPEQIPRSAQSASSPSINPQKPGKPIKIKQDCIYCLLANKLMPSLIIYEDKKYLAALEIKPFSEGHIILIPKKHTRKAKSLSSKAFAIANKIGKHLVKKLKALNFTVNSSDEMKHAIINIIPSYKNKKISTERIPAAKEQLQKLALKIGRFEEKKKKTPKNRPGAHEKISQPAPEIREERIRSEIIKLPRRIP